MRTNGLAEICASTQKKNLYPINKKETEKEKEKKEKKKKEKKEIGKNKEKNS